MIKKSTLAGLIILVAGSLLMAACGAKPTPAAVPTVDANMIYTQAAQTVQAGLAQTEAAQPATSTLPPPTATVAPAAATKIVDPTLASAMTATAKSVLPGAATQTPTKAGAATATKVAVAPTTNAAPPKSTGDKAELVGQVPGDGSRIPAGNSFDVALTFKNTGTTTWNSQYQLKFFAGDSMGSPNDVNFTKTVKPGETITLNFTMGGVSTLGAKNTIWVLQNPDGVNFYSLYLKTDVVDD